MRTVLEGGNIAAPLNPDPEYSVSLPELGTGVPFDGLWLLYRVQEKVSEQSARRVRLLVDFCLGIGVCVHAVEKLLEGRLFLLHDLCPQNKDPADGRKLGHLTAAYRNGAGKKVHHTLAVYTELSSSGSVRTSTSRKPSSTLSAWARRWGTTWALTRTPSPPCLRTVVLRWASATPCSRVSSNQSTEFTAC